MAVKIGFKEAKQRLIAALRGERYRHAARKAVQSKNLPGRGRSRRTLSARSSCDAKGKTTKARGIIGTRTWKCIFSGVMVGT